MTRLFEDEELLAFPDLHPQAPTHILIIPKRHIASLAHSSAEDAGLLGKLLIAATTVASRQNLSDGYRVVINTGSEGGQTVDHLHVHPAGRAAHGMAAGLMRRVTVLQWVLPA